MSRWVLVVRIRHTYQTVLGEPSGAIVDRRTVGNRNTSAVPELLRSF